MHCSSCNKTIESDNDIKRGICFSCHVKGIRFGFRATGYGRANWNGPTVREVQKSYEDSDDFKSGKISKVPERAELI
jgi:hypothetical protein